MKKLGLVLVCFFIFTVSISAESLQNEDGKLAVSLESTNVEYNLGSIERGEVIHEIVWLRNNLEQPLAIKEARSTCECIDSSTDSQVVDRGEVFEVEITFDTQGISQGDAEEVIYILTENMDYEIIRLLILATIVDTK
ncbi:DUF1573 domain-containing protein [Candidatus Omnitrophota bacterium]